MVETARPPGAGSHAIAIATLVAGVLLVSIFAASHHQGTNPLTFLLLLLPYAIAAGAAVVASQSPVCCGLAATSAVIVGGVGVWIATLDSLDGQFGGLVVVVALQAQLLAAGVGLALVAIVRLISRS